MSDEQTCQYLGHPSGGFFYYRNLKTSELIVVETNDEVDRFISGEFDQCPPHIVLDEHRPVFVCARGLGVRTVTLDIFLPYSTEDAGEQQCCVSLDDLIWLIVNEHIPYDRVVLGEGLDHIRRLFDVLFVHATRAICRIDKRGNPEDY